MECKEPIEEETADMTQQRLHDRVKVCIKHKIHTSIVIDSMSGKMNIGLQEIIALGEIDKVPSILKSKGWYYHSVTTHH